MKWNSVRFTCKRNATLPTSLTRGTQTGDPGCWAMGTNTVNYVRWAKYVIFCTGLTRVAKEGLKSIVSARRTQWTNQGRTPVICTPGVPPFASVSTVSRGHPYLVSLGEIQIRRQQRKRNYKLCQMNQPRKDPFHIYSKIPHLPQFGTRKQGPPLSSLSGWDPNKTTAKKEEL